jgi:hypothetical protein
LNFSDRAYLIRTPTNVLSHTRKRRFPGSSEEDPQGIRSDVLAPGAELNLDTEGFGKLVVDERRDAGDAGEG